MEVERESLRARQLRARDLLRGDLEGRDLEEYVEERLLTTTLENVLNWGRSNAIFPMTFGLACCAIEQISLVTSRYDIARFGVSFYMIAMLFILFDIEVVFLYPVGVLVHATKSVFVLVEILVFVVLLLVALIFVWRRGALDWK